MYNHLFFTNILRILDENGDHERTTLENIWVSILLISDLSNGKGIPSLRIMERIADALDKPLTELLEETDRDSKSLEALAGGKLRGIAEGYERISLILSSHQAFITRPWTKEAMEKLKKQKEENEKNPRKLQNNK